MFYYYLNFFIWFCNIFGLRKPTLNSSNNQFHVSFWNKIWSFVIIVCLVASYSLTGKFRFNIKKHFDKLSTLNEVFVNVAIILIELLNDENVCMKLYETIVDSFHRFQINDKSLKVIAFELYFWIFVSTITFVTSIILETLQSEPPFVLFIKIPVFLLFCHLVVHLYLILTLLKVVNSSLSRMFMFGSTNENIKHSPFHRRLVFYVFNFDNGFIDGTNLQGRYEIKMLCRVYDDLNSCVKLLEKDHGLQMLLTTWLMFSSGVAGVTLVSSQQAKLPWLVVANSILPFAWCLVGCCVDDQLRKEVDKTETFIMKHLIDFRCDPSRKNALQSFKQLVGSQRLQFTACGLFHLNFSMVLGTLVNVVTYSIILIQFIISN